jgi:hypothetical protein
MKLMRKDSRVSSLFLFFLLLQFFSNVLSQSTLTKKGLEVEENRQYREKRAFNPEGSIISVRYNQPRTLLTVSIMDTTNPNIVRVSETVGCPGTCAENSPFCSCFTGFESQNSYDEKTGWLHTLYKINSTHFGILSQHLLSNNHPLAFSFSGVSNIYYPFFDPKRKMLLFVGKRTPTTTNVELFGLEVVDWIKTAGSRKEEGRSTKRNLEVIHVEEIIPQSIFYFDQAIIGTDETWETQLAPLSMCYFDSPSGQLYLLPFVKGPGGAHITNGVDMMKMILYDVEALSFLKSTLMTYVEDPFPSSFWAFQVRAGLSSLQLDGKTGTLYAVFKSSVISKDDHSLYIIQFSPTTGKFSKVKLITDDPVCSQTPASTIDSDQSIFYIYCTPFLYNGWLPTLEVFKPVPSFIVDPQWMTRTNKKMLNSSTSQGKPPSFSTFLSPTNLLIPNMTVG